MKKELSRYISVSDPTNLRLSISRVLREEQIIGTTSHGKKLEEEGTSSSTILDRQSLICFVNEFLRTKNIRRKCEKGKYPSKAAGSNKKTRHDNKY